MIAKKEGLSTLKDYYHTKPLIYEKYPESAKDGGYFATFLLKLNSMNTKGSPDSAPNRQTKSALPSSRATTDRPSLSHRPTI